MRSSLSNTLRSPLWIAAAAAAVLLLIFSGRIFGVFSRGLRAAAGVLHAPATALGNWWDASPTPDEADEKMLSAVADIRRLSAENAELRAALGYREKHPDALVAARVISESDDASLAALRIDRGSEDGLAAGQAVIIGDGVLVGRLRSVSRYSAVVLLITDSRSRLAVSAGDLTETIGVLEGDRGLSVGVSLIPQSVPLTVGDVIVTSGLEPGIRRGFAVGSVEKIEKSVQASFQSAVIKPFSLGRHPSVVQVVVPAPEMRAATE